MAGSARNEKLEAAARKVGLKPLTPQEAAGKVPVIVTIEGADAGDLAKLLEDTAKFITAAAGSLTAGPYENKDVMFERLEVHDFVTIAHRS
jgi:hypothetical protein